MMIRQQLNYWLQSDNLVTTNSWESGLIISVFVIVSDDTFYPHKLLSITLALE